MKLRDLNKISLLIWGIIILFTGLYLSLIFNENIWTDEAFTLQLLRSSGNIQEMIAWTARDVHPPLYYLYANLFTIFGDDLIYQKIAAILPMLATLVFGATVIRKHFGDLASLLFLLFAACIPCSMEFAVQVRMYSLAFFCVTVCGVSAYLAFSDGRKRDFTVFALSGVGAAYLHYFAFVSVIIIAGMLLLGILLWNRVRLLRWLITALGMVVLYLPWIPSFIQQVRSVTNDYWIPEITAESVWTYFTWMFDLAVLPGTVFLFILLLIGASHYNTVLITKGKNPQNIYALACMLVPVITAVSGLILSWLTRPIYRDQYVFPSLGLLALFIGITMSKAKKSVIILLSVFLLLVGAGQYREVFQQEYHNSNLPQTLAFFQENLQEDDYIIYNWENFGFIYKCHWPPEQVVYLGEFDFSGDFGTVWFLNSEWLDGIDESLLSENGLQIERMAGEFGIEDNLFSIHRISRQ